MVTPTDIIPASTILYVSFNSLFTLRLAGSSLLNSVYMADMVFNFSRRVGKFRVEILRALRRLSHARNRQRRRSSDYIQLRLRNRICTDIISY